MIFLIWGSKMDSQRAGRYPDGFVSKFRFRWHLGEPVAIFLDPKRDPDNFHLTLAPVVVC